MLLGVLDCKIEFVCCGKVEHVVERVFLVVKLSQTIWNALASISLRPQRRHL
jgi:hypothetical protein